MIKYLLKLATLQFIFVIATGCSAEKYSGELPELKVPQRIFQKANEFIISRTSQEFFEDNVQADFNKIRELGGNYEMHYLLKIKGMDFINEKIYFMVDTAGTVLEKFDIIGIPDCKSDPSHCVFELDQSDVKEIAEVQKLPKGIRDWEISFRWSTETNQYVWYVLATEYETGSGENYKARGKEMMISPADGQVLKFRTWNIR